MNHSEMTTEELFYEFLDTGNEYLKDFADEEQWDRLHNEMMTEQRGLEALESQRQDI